MKKHLLPFVLIFSIVLLIGSCSKDDDAQTPDIYGSWTVLQSDQNGLVYNVELKINNDNSYDWLLLDEVEGHSNSYAEFTLADNIMTITSDADCSYNGEYYLIVESDKLAIIAISDECGPRATALEWVWKKM